MDNKTPVPGWRLLISLNNKDIVFNSFLWSFCRTKSQPDTKDKVAACMTPIQEVNYHQHNLSVTVIPAEQQRGHSLTACNTALPAKSNMAVRGPKNGQFKSWKHIDCIRPHWTNIWKESLHWKSKIKYFILLFWMGIRVDYNSENI